MPQCRIRPIGGFMLMLCLPVSFSLARDLPAAPASSGPKTSPCQYAGLFIGGNKGFYTLTVRGEVLSGMYYFIGSDFMARQYNFTINGKVQASGASAVARVAGNADGTGIDYGIDISPTPDGTGLQYTIPTNPSEGRLLMKRVSIGECS